MAEEAGRRARKRVLLVQRNTKTISGTCRFTSPAATLTAQAMLTDPQIVVLPIDRLLIYQMYTMQASVLWARFLLLMCSFLCNCEPAQISPKDTA